MRRTGKAFVLALIMGAVSACSQPSPPPGSPDIPPAATEPEPVAEPGPAEQVRQLLAEAEAQPRSGGRPDALQRLQQARTLAAGDAALLAQVARAALAWDSDAALAIARQALEVDRSMVEAQVVEGAVLYRTGQFKLAMGVLEPAYQQSGNLEAGYYLAAIHEAFGQVEEARKVLSDLLTRFPESDPVKRGLARLDSLAAVWPEPGIAGTELADWKRDPWWVAGGLLIGLHADEQTLEALDAGGHVRWRQTCGHGAINDVAVGDGTRRAYVVTDAQGCLLDLQSGEVLGTGPGAGRHLWLEGFDWRREFMAIGRPVEHPTAPPSAYFGVNWTVWRLSEQEGGQVRFEQMHKAPVGSRKAALSRDGRTLFSWYGNHGAGDPKLFRDGALVTDYRGINVGAEFALDPREDRFYQVRYDGLLEAHSLDGGLLWQAPAYKSGRPIVWSDGAGEIRIAVWHHENTTVYDDRGAPLWSAPGIPLAVAGPYLMVRDWDAFEIRLLGQDGQVVMHYPGDGFFSRDYRGVVQVSAGHIRLYRLP